MDKRASGVLMHISSLPGQYGIGSFGQAAYDFVDFLEASHQSYWQLLPLTTTSYGDSPYQSFSAVAGNPHFIDLDMLVEAGYLEKEDLVGVDFGSDPEVVDYARIFMVRRPLLEKAVRALLESPATANFERFKQENRAWLLDYADFMAFKEHFDNRSLQEWGDDAAIQRDSVRVAELRKELSAVVTYHQVVQYFFFSQWAALKDYANVHGIEIIGDMPIYISADSVEVWTQPHLFKLDPDCKPRYIAGVPPDNFSATGQLWGNPIYDWEAHKKEDYAWWIFRIQESFKLYDYLRIDHFKGFSDFWQIPGGDETAVRGKWVPGPGYDLFRAVKESLGDLNIIAEDLGNIDEKARQLLADCGYPGMKIMEFGFYDIKGKSIDIPHHYTAHSVAYTGTHDNEVVNGWYQNLTQEQRDYTDAYINRRAGEPITRAFLRTLFATVSDTAIATMQDILDKPASSRMNLPNTVGQNWKWRMVSEDLTEDKIEFLKDITERYNRGKD
ncbi:4-alpha-glucanotransferase [Streptococcus sp. DD13]|uniref:4-alpha-glucanotransferase n=1 Tax=Streptococcus sp. DD13 TaxID=1777881 RepID=UPI0007937F68|nr:4-alpha-glucanotransferase [Streptococcus sp. DD13]KXT78114.1 4-alpha-glucanotransferase (amylomaltase) [Streptococcus sp. DD13]